VQAAARRAVQAVTRWEEEAHQGFQTLPEVSGNALRSALRLRAQGGLTKGGEGQGSTSTRDEADTSTAGAATTTKAAAAAAGVSEEATAATRNTRCDVASQAGGALSGPSASLRWQQVLGRRA
jgi:hypothetical protein